MGLLAALKHRWTRRITSDGEYDSGSDSAPSTTSSPWSPIPLWYANESLAALHRTLVATEFFFRPERFERMARDAAHVTFGDITSHEWRHDWPIGDTITIRLPQRYQAGA